MFFIVHALVSFGPTVKNVIRSSRLNPVLINLFSPDSYKFKSLRNSFFSVSSKIAISDSIEPEIIIESQFSVLALSNMFLVKLFPLEASSSLTLHA